MLIYRIERDGDGPYVREDDEDYIIPVCADRHPSLRMEDDAAEKRFRQWKTAGINVRFGFSSLDQLTRWFTLEERGILRGRGFDIHGYEVMPENVITTPRQAAFKYNGAVPVGVVEWPGRRVPRRKSNPQQMELF